MLSTSVVQRGLGHRPRHDDRRGRRAQGRRTAREATSSTAGATRSYAPARRRINASSPSTTPTGFPRGCPARGTSSSSTTAAAGRRAITRPWTRSSSPSTQGDYTAAGKPFGPDKADLVVHVAKRDRFFSPFISGADRLPNGDTLICRHDGMIFEVTPKGETVWKYANPEKGELPFGGPGFGLARRPAAALPPSAALRSSGRLCRRSSRASCA